MYEHKNVAWIELFFDLIFVAAIHQLATVLKHMTFLEALPTFGLFLPIIWVWVSHTLYTNHFLDRSWFYHFVTFVQMGCVLALVIQVPTALANPTLFAWTYVLVKALLVMQYVFSSLMQFHKIFALFPLIVGYGASAVIWWLSTMSQTPIIWWLIAMLIDFLTPVMAKSRAVSETMNSQHLVERFGLLTVIVLGEVVISLVASSYGQPLESDLIAVLISGVLVVTFAFWAYLRYCMAVLDHGQSSSRIYIYSHIPLVLGLVCIAAGFKAVIEGLSTSWLLVSGMTLFVLSFRFLAYLVHRRFLMRHLLLTACFMPILAWYYLYQSDPIFTSAVLASAFVVYMFLSEVFMFMPSQPKKKSLWDDQPK